MNFPTGLESYIIIHKIFIYFFDLDIMIKIMQNIQVIDIRAPYQDIRNFKMH